MQDWLDEVATHRTGSKKTAALYLSRLTDYCNWRKKNPDELLMEDTPYREGKKMTVAESKYKHDARKLFQLAKKVTVKKPMTMITDGLPAYNKACRKEFWTLRKPRT